MTKIAFIDIDRVCANGDVRFALAEGIKQQCLTLNGTTKQAIDAYWRAAFNPAHVACDTLMDEQVASRLDAIAKDYTIIFLTSRPEYLREATQKWLDEHGIGTGRELVMKPAVNQFHKTREWKVWTIHLIAGMRNASEVLVIDNEQANLDELQRQDAPFSLKCFTSLEMKEPEPVASEEEEDDHPF